MLLHCCSIVAIYYWSTRSNNNKEEEQEEIMVITFTQQQLKSTRLSGRATDGWPGAQNRVSVVQFNSEKSDVIWSGGWSQRLHLRRRDSGLLLYGVRRYGTMACLPVLEAVGAGDLEDKVKGWWTGDPEHALDRRSVAGAPNAHLHETLFFLSKYGLPQ